MVHGTIRMALGHLARLAICTDACKGLETVVKMVFPWVDHKECFRHLMENMKKYYSREVYGKNMCPAVSAYTPKKHKCFLDKVLQASPDVQKWLDDHRGLLWSRIKFCPNIKADYINNNLAESCNFWIKDMKDLPVHCLVDAIRKKEVILFEKRRMTSMALEGHILPVVVHQPNATSKGLGHLKGLEVMKTGQRLVR